MRTRNNNQEERKMSDLHFAVRKEENGSRRVYGSLVGIINRPINEGGSTVSERTVTVGSEDRKVFNVLLSLKINEYDTKKLKYFFDIDAQPDTYLPVRVSMWGIAVERLAKYAPREHEPVEFYFSSGKPDTYKDRTRLDITAFDFEPRGRKKGKKRDEADEPNSYENDLPF
jgi:hypothetical protein